MVISELPQCLNCLVREIDNFSISDSVNTIVYDNAVLVKIIRDKEIADVCGVSQETLLEFDYIYSELGDIVSTTHNVVINEMLFKYEQLERRIDNAFCGLFHLYAKQVALSVKALLYYKASQYEEAFAYTLECIELNEILVEEGMCSLLYRCVEQNRNIARIYQKQGKHFQSNELLKNIFSYLLTGEADLRLMHGCMYSQKKLWTILPTLRESYTYELFKLTVGDLLRSGHNDQALATISWYNELHFEVTNVDRQIIYNWVYINNLLHNQNYDEYVDSLIYFFKQEINHTYDPLKLFLIRDLGILLKKNVFYNTETILAKLVHYLEGKVRAKGGFYYKLVYSHLTS